MKEALKKIVAAAGTGAAAGMVMGLLHSAAEMSPYDFQAKYVQGLNAKLTHIDTLNPRRTIEGISILQESAESLAKNPADISSHMYTVGWKLESLEQEANTYAANWPSNASEWKVFSTDCITQVTEGACANTYIADASVQLTQAENKIKEEMRQMPNLLPGYIGIGVVASLLVASVMGVRKQRSDTHSSVA